MDTERLNKELSKAKIKLIQHPNSAFIATICFSLIHKFDRELPTAGTDGRHVHYNPEFWDSLNPRQQLGLIVHEVWHVALGHCAAMDDSRIKNRDPQKWNVACDFVINNMLVKAGFSLPPTDCVDKKYTNMSSEQVYDLLPNDNTQQLMGGTMDILPSSGDPEEVKRDLDDLLVQATLQSQMQGNDPGSIPGDIKVRVEKLTNPKLPWHVLLKRYFTSKINNDYSFQKPNRRFLPDFYLPSMYSDALGNVAMAIDMSGSVSNSETNQFVTDVYHVISKINLSKLSLVQFDTRVFAVDEISTVKELLQIDFSGRGGTQIDPVMEWGEENKPDVLVVFSDGYFSDPSIDPKVPVLWVIHNNPSFKAPYGKVIHYEINT